MSKLPPPALPKGYRMPSQSERDFEAWLERSLPTIAKDGTELEHELAWAAWQAGAARAAAPAEPLPVKTWFCNKCGYIGDHPQHLRPKTDAPCNYLACPTDWQKDAAPRPRLTQEQVEEAMRLADTYGLSRYAMGADEGNPQYSADCYIALRHYLESL